MNEMSLSRLYRRLTAGPSASVDAGRLVDAVAGKQADADVAAGLAQSSRLSALARMLGELDPASSELAEAVNPARRAAHPAPHRETRRHAAVRRQRPAPLRWAGGLAACLAVALGVVGIWRGHQAERWNDVDANVSVATHPDRIFTTRDQIFASSSDAGQRAHGRGDELFRGDFSGG